MSETFKLMTPMPMRSRMTWHGKQGIVFTFPSAKPNAWYRFWQRILCNIRWEDVVADPQEGTE